MDKQEATKEIAAILKVAEAAIEKAMAIADEAGVSFTFNLGGADNVDREIGGSYYGKGMELSEDEIGEVKSEWGSSDHYESIGEAEIKRTYGTGTYTMEQYKLNRGAWSAWTSSSELC